MAGGLFWRILRWTGDGTRIRGFEVVGADELTARQRGTLVAALDLVDVQAPWILTHAHRDIPGLVIGVVGWEVGRFTGALWFRPERMDDDPDSVAASLVYFFTLARVRCRLGRDRRTAYRRFRMAFERQLWFARHLAAGIALVEHLTRAHDSGYFERANQLKLREERYREVGVPGKNRRGVAVAGPSHRLGRRR